MNLKAIWCGFFGFEHDYAPEAAALEVSNER
jgi:hypothetical protein